MQQHIMVKKQYKCIQNFEIRLFVSLN